MVGQADGRLAGWSAGRLVGLVGWMARWARPGTPNGGIGAGAPGWVVAATTARPTYSIRAIPFYPTEIHDP